LEHRETLLTIAELAVALAGFASLVSVIGGRANDVARVSASLRLRAMLEIALRNAAFALLPLPFLQFAPSDPVIWRISSGVYIAATAGHFLLRLRSTAALGEGWHSVTNLILFSVTVVVGLANVFGLGGSKAFSLYLSNLLLGLGAAGLSFISVATSVFGSEGEGPAA
jgi:hypothetical protein